MIFLGEFEGYALTVNQSNVESELVTYHLYECGRYVGFSREDVFCDPNAATPDDHLYQEAKRRYNAMGRSFAGNFDDFGGIFMSWFGHTFLPVIQDTFENRQWKEDPKKAAEIIRGDDAAGLKQVADFVEKMSPEKWREASRMAGLFDEDA